MRSVSQQSNTLLISLALVAILGLTFFLRMKFWNQPFQMDEGVYGYIGWGMLDGLVPYKDVFDHKPPGIYLLYSLVFLLTEPSALNVKVFASIYTLVTALAVFLLTRKVAGTRAGCLSMLLFGIFSCGPKIEGGGVNAEIFMILPYTLAAYFLLQAAETDKRKSYFLAGLFTGLACTIKQVAVVNFLWIVGFLLFRIWRRRTEKTAGEIIADGAAVAVGTVLPWIPFVLYFYVNDALRAFFYWQVSFNFGYMDQGPKYLENLTILYKQMRMILSENLVLWLLAVVGLSFLWRRVSEPEDSYSDTALQHSEKRVVLLLMATWPLFSFLGIMLGGGATTATTSSRSSPPWRFLAGLGWQVCFMSFAQGVEAYCGNPAESSWLCSSSPLACCLLEQMHPTICIMTQSRFLMECMEPRFFLLPALWANISGSEHSLTISSTFGRQTLKSISTL